MSSFNILPKRFRALIIGRANAGKTTILRSICGSRDNPEVSHYGLTHLMQWLDHQQGCSFHRGKLTLYDPLCLPSITFHTAWGAWHQCWTSFFKQYKLCLPWFPGIWVWMGGGASNYKRIYKWACKYNISWWQAACHLVCESGCIGSLTDQTLRYCIPTDNERLITAAEQQFFNECDTQGGKGSFIILHCTLSHCCGQFLSFFFSQSLMHWMQKPFWSLKKKERHLRRHIL